MCSLSSGNLSCWCAGNYFFSVWRHSHCSCILMKRESPWQLCIFCCLPSFRLLFKMPPSKIGEKSVLIPPSGYWGNPVNALPLSFFRCPWLGLSFIIFSLIILQAKIKKRENKLINLLFFYVWYADSSSFCSLCTPCCKKARKTVWNHP